MEKSNRKAWLKDMVAVRIDSLTEAEAAKIRKDLTIEKRTLMKSKPMKAFVEDYGWMWLPRVYGLRTLLSMGFRFKDQRPVHEDIPFEVDLSILGKHPYPKDQLDLVKIVKTKSFGNRLGGFAVAPTGSGKTLMGTFVGALLKGPTLIVVHKSDLIENWVKSIALVRLNGKPVKPGIIRGKQCDFGPEFPFVIAMAHSLSQKDQPEEMYRAFRTVIGDEIHHLPAEELFFPVFSKFQARYLIGFTATLRRKDGTEDVFNHMIGDVLYTMIRDKVKGRIFFIEVPFLLEPSRLRAAGNISLSKIDTAFSTLEYRNMEIVKHLLAAYKEGRKNLVLCGVREHTQILKKMFPPIVQKRTGIYIGGKSQKKLEEAAAKQIVLATYGMAYEGMDVPDMDMLTLATPRKDIEQPTGRILRFHPDKMDPVVLDFVDRYKPLIRWARERATYYRSEGFTFKTAIPA